MSQQPDVPLDGLYGDLVMDHYRNPHNRARLDEADVEAEEFNPFCGDKAVWRLKLDGEGKVCGVMAIAEGCSIIQAATSMLSDAPTIISILHPQPARSASKVAS